MALGLDEAGFAVVADVDRAGAFAVLVDAADDVGGYADVEATAIAVRHDVDPAAFSHRWIMRGRCGEEKRGPASSTGRRSGLG